MVKTILSVSKLRIRRSNYLLIVMLLSAIVLFSSASCKAPSKAAKAEKKQQELKKKKAKEGEKFYQEGLKKHQKLQTKDTQKRMKQTQKKSQESRKKKKKKSVISFPWLKYKLTKNTLEKAAFIFRIVHTGYKLLPRKGRRLYPQCVCEFWD